MAHRSKFAPTDKPFRRDVPESLAADEPITDQLRRDRNWLYGERDDGRRCGYVMIPNAFVYALPFDLACFLAILADWERRKSEAENDGWFYFPTKWIEQHARAGTKKVQERLFRQLRELKVIKTRMTYNRRKNRRWIWINWNVVRSLAADFVDTGLDLDGGGRHRRV